MFDWHLKRKSLIAGFPEATDGPRGRLRGGCGSFGVLVEDDGCGAVRCSKTTVVSHGAFGCISFLDALGA